MTAQTQLGVAPIDDSMELATSPFQHVDDLDLDLDQIENQEVPTDNLMNDTAEGADFIDDIMERDENAEFLEDENMIEDQEAGHGEHADDFDMNEELQDNQHQTEPQDEDILYDEDDAIEPVEGNLDQGDEYLAEDDEALDVPLHEPETLTTQAETYDQPEETTYQDNQGSAATTNEDPGLAEVTYAAVVDEPGLEHDADVPALEAIEQQGSDLDAPSVSTPQNQNAGERSHAADGYDASEHPPGADAHADTAPVSSLAEDAEYENGTEGLVEDSTVQEALHAIRLDWGDKVFPLFPTTDGDASQSFVSDTSFAYEPLSKLLMECHHVIQAELECAFQDELVLDVDALGLHICEDSKYAEQISLAQIVEVYILLKRNESDDDIAPLPCRISSRTCLRSQYDYLLDAAKQHRTFSSIISESDPSSPLAQDGGDEALDLAEGVSAQDEIQQENVSEAGVPVAEGDPSAASTKIQGDSVYVPVVVQPNETEDFLVGNVTENPDAISVHADNLNDQDEPKQEAVESLEQQDVFADEDLFEGLNDQAEPAAEVEAEQSLTVEAEGSASSHTVEDDSMPHHETYEQGEKSNDQLGDGDEVAFFGADSIGTEPVNVEPAEDIFYIGDDEPADAQAQESNGATTEALHDVHHSIEDKPSAQANISVPASDGVDKEVDHASSVEATVPPITPQKSIPSKRKAPEEEEEEEEEDDLLDFSFDTPEPKRTRAV